LTKNEKTRTTLERVPEDKNLRRIQVHAVKSSLRTCAWPLWSLDPYNSRTRFREKQLQALPLSLRAVVGVLMKAAQVRAALASTPE